MSQPRSAPSGPIDQLAAARRAFSAYHEETSRPLLDMSEMAEAEYSLSELAARLQDRQVRARFKSLAIEMLEANIDHYEGDASMMPVIQTNYTPAIVIALLAAAVGDWLFEGLTPALLAAAIAYPSAASIMRSSVATSNRKAEQHNQLVPHWRFSVDDWKAEIARLKRV